MVRILLWIVIFAVGVDARAAQDSPATGPRLVIKGGKVVYDRWTNLTWQRCSVGQRWVKETGCVGTVMTFTFGAAQLLGRGIWRVPTKDELATLIDYRRRADIVKPTIDEAKFPNMNIGRLVYWSSTSAGDSDGWGVYFDAGYPGNYDRSGSYAVRLVRGGGSPNQRSALR